MSNSSVKSLIVTAVLLAAAIVLLVQTRRVSSGLREVAALRARVESAEREAATAKSELAKAIQAAENDPRNAEIARLRAELASLRRQQAEAQAETARLRQAVEAAGRAVKPNAGEEEEAADPEREAAKTIGIAKLNYGKHWALAFILFAEEHGGRMPATLDEAAAFFGTQGGQWAPSTVLDPRSHSLLVTTEVGGAHNVTVIGPDQYEITYRGLLKDVPNPATTIVLREKEPFPSPLRPGPGLSRTYVFADGHSEIHYAADGDFSAWERDRLVGGAK